jgi:hypothetical protein
VKSDRSLTKASQSAIARIDRLRASGDWHTAGRATVRLRGTSPNSSAVRKIVTKVAADLLRVARVAYQRGDTRKARGLLRTLSQLGRRYAKQADKLAKRFETDGQPIGQYRRKTVVSKGAKKAAKKVASRKRRWSSGDKLESLPQRPAFDSIERSLSVSEFEVWRGGAQRDHQIRRSRGGQARSEPKKRTRSQPTTTGKGSASRDMIERRTPHMDLSTAKPLKPGTRFTVLVYADDQSARASEQSEGIVISAPPSVTRFQIDIKLVCSAHFTVVHSSSSRRLIIWRKKARTNEVKFEVAVAPLHQLPKTKPRISALFYYLERPSGKVTREPVIEGLKVSKTRDEGRKIPTSDAFGDPNGDAPPTLEVQHGAFPADFTISVLEGDERDGCHFKMIADARSSGDHWEGTWSLPRKTDEIVTGAMEQFTASTQSPITRIAALKGAGIEMFRATPKKFQDMFWQMVDRKALPKNILVISEEPYVPWELMVPQRYKTDGTIETREALGVEFPIGRWVTTTYVSPPQKIALEQTYVVAPQYGVGRELRNSAKEAQMVQKLFSPSSRISPALVKNIDSTLAQGGTTLLHFVCHGKAGFPQAISLEQDREQLSSWDVRALKGFLDSFPKARTFVFLNACEVGRTMPALVGVGGFGNSFVEIGSSAVVAPLWSVDDDIAHKVATEFYRAVVNSPTIPFAEVLRRIRANGYSGQADDSWAAYCFYGDPSAHRV